MNIHTKILSKQVLGFIMVFLMMGWASNAFAASDPIYAKWDFTQDSYPATTIQSKTATLTANEGEALEMSVDATSGKLADNSGKKRAQFNKGTILHVPVISKKDIVEVSVNNGNSTSGREPKFVTINGDPMESAIVSHKATDEEVAKGYVEIKAEGYTGSSSNTYIYYVSVTQYPPVYEEKQLYYTEFVDGWTAQAAKVPAITVDKKTTDGQTLTFTLNNTQIDPTKKQGSQQCVTTGALIAAKEKTGVEANFAYIETSLLKSVTKIRFVQATSGGKDYRGWGVQAICDGDTTDLYTTPIKNTSGEEITIDGLDLKNVKLRFYNILKSENSYMESLDIYGKVEVKDDVNITYYDTDGTTILASETVSADKSLTYMEGINDKVTIPSGYVFRGWFDSTESSALKVMEGTELSADLSLYAWATPKESAAVNTEYSYDMTQRNFYPEDHELIDVNGAAWESRQHGWVFSTDGTIKLQVASTAQIDITLCNQSKNGTITVTDKSGNEISSFTAKTGDDATVQTISYSGKATVLTLNIPAGTYIHGLTLFNYKPVYVSFKFPNDKTEGKCPETIKANTKYEVTMPDNTLFSRLGWTFQGWTDGTNIYEVGKTYVITENITLTPKVTENKYSLTDTNTPVSVTWPFDHRKAPVINLKKSAEFVYNKVTTIENEKQDIALKINTTNGKIDNTDTRINALNNGAEGAQVNTGTIFSVPAVYGMTVIIHGADKVDNENNNTTCHFGTADNDSKVSLGDYTVPTEDQTISDNGKTLSLIYKGDATTLNIKMDWAGTTNAWGFYKDITVVYPVLPFVYAENVIEDADLGKYPNEKAENAGTIDYQTTDSYPNTGNRHKVGDVVTVVATPAYGYDIKGYRVKGTETLLPTKEITNEAGTKLLATDYTVGDGISYIEAIYTHQTLHKITLKPSDTSLGSVSLSPIIENFYNEIHDAGENGEQGKLLRIESWFTEGTEVTASASPASECVVDYWTEGEEDDAAHVSEANIYTFKTGSKDQTIVVHLKQGEIGSVIFDISDAHVNGESVASSHKNAISMTISPINNVRSFTIPTNYTFFKSVDDKDEDTDNAYHLLYWIDQADNNNRYELGKTYSFRTAKTITLTPVFEANPTTRTNRVNNPIIRYDFGTKIYSYTDPGSKQQRNTCAPIVDIDNNTNTYWTAQGYFEVLTNGVVTAHTRDVSMFVNTGDKGYIRNTDLGDWCAFGPGTTFWCTSSVGTTVSILTYSKITTTTIDGVVPTLNEKRTAEEREKAGNDHIYVYSYTTQNAATTMPIVIGNDYSYYQWIEVSMLAANMVNLHTSVDDTLHGKVDNVESLSDFGAVEQEDGSYAFRMGDRLRVTFERLFGFAFDKIVDAEKTDADGNPITLLRLNDNNTVDMVDEDYVMHTISQNADGTWGTESGDAKTVFTLKATEPTEKEAADGKRTTYKMEYDITTHRKIEIIFKEKPTYYVTYNAGSFASGLPPVAQWMEAGDKYTIPKNNSLYYEGNTLDHWVDEDYDESMTDEEKEQHTFYIGKEYTALAEDVQMYPVFNPNEFSILDLDKAATSTWHFAKNDGAPAINYERTAGILVTQLQKGEQKIDLKIDLDATAFMNENGKNLGTGKFNNTSSNERIQVNRWSKINFPASPKCVVRVTSTSGDPSAIMVAGKKKGDTGYNSISSNIMEVTCTGDSAYHRAIVLGDNLYLRDFAITYQPQDEASKSTIETLSCDGVTLDATEIKRQMAADGHVTFTVSPWKTANEKIPAVTGTATNGGTVTAKEATVFTKETAATVSTALGINVESYPIKFEFATPEDYPVFEKVTVNGTEYTATDNVVQDVPQSGIIKVLFNRTMQETTFDIEELHLKSTSSAGKELEFRYWDLPEGGTIQLNITSDLEMFKDIYGKVCQQPLTLTLHIIKNTDRYHHHPFDFIVGKDGTIDEAIAAANANTKDNDHRYFIFVPDGEYHLTGNEPVQQLGNLNNEITLISKSRVSLIGQSKDGTILWNKPTQEGISYTGTIHLGKNTTDFYSQDLTLENRFDYWGPSGIGGGGGAGRAVAFWDQGNKSVMKNVALMSWQDTYYSNNANSNFRGYFENCDIAGIVDFLCGDGDIWWEKCNLLIRDRTGNNIAAPATGVGQQWGYVLNNCTIKPETEHPQQLKGKDWTLARAWNDSPAITYLNTKMVTEPTSEGWGRMNTNEVLRFHEYRSMNGDGTALLTLGTRTLSACSPGVGSDNCVLTDAQAAQYTLRNVLGGTDAFEPNELCRQIDAASSTAEDRDENSMTWDDGILIDDNNLQWNVDERALCYFIFKQDANGKWIYQTNTTENSVSLTSFGSGYYCVRAANQRGGLGAATKSILFSLTDPYELDLKQLGDLEVDGKPYGWSTICLPFNARVPEGITVYAATAHDKTDENSQVTDYTMTLTSVDIIDGEKGYIVYGPAGKHYFTPTSRSCEQATILTGNATREPISTTNNPGYVLANKNWGLGFYKYNGATYAAYKAWLPQDMVSDIVQDALSTGARAIRFTFADGTNAIRLPFMGEETEKDVYYNLSGQRIPTPSASGIYIKQGKGKFMKK